MICNGMIWQRLLNNDAINARSEAMTPSSIASGLSPRGIDGHQVQVASKIDSWKGSRHNRLRHSAPPHLTFASSTAARLAASREAAAKGRGRRETDQSTVPANRRSTAAVPKLEICVDTSRARSNLDVVRLCINELGWKEVRYVTCCSVYYAPLHGHITDCLPSLCLSVHLCITCHTPNFKTKKSIMLNIEENMVPPCHEYGAYTKVKIARLHNIMLRPEMYQLWMKGRTSDLVQHIKHIIQRHKR